MAIEKEGTYKGRAVGQVVLGKSAQKGTPQIEFYFQVGNDRVRWTGYFGPNSAARTIESLQHCGWEGDELSDFADGELHGLDKNEPELVIEIEKWTDENGMEHETPRVQWVNGGARGPNVENAMSKDEALSFSDKMKGLVLKAKSKKPPAQQKEESESFDHGANAPAEKKASGAKRGW